MRGRSPQAAPRVLPLPVLSHLVPPATFWHYSCQTSPLGQRATDGQGRHQHVIRQWVGAGGTHPGQVRPGNEDALAVLGAEGIYVVADGMGGHAAGEVASGIAIEEIVAALRESSAGAARRDQVADALQRANQRILAEADREPERSGMGTTATLLWVDPGSDHYIIGHVGDSRAYRLRDHVLKLLTRDHTWVQLEVDSGRLSPDQARRHPYSSVLLQALGVEEAVTPDVFEDSAAPGDLFLLCSDGLTATMTDPQLKRILERLADASPPVLVRELIREANQHGAPDNVTVIAIRVIGDVEVDAPSEVAAA